MVSGTVVVHGGSAMHELTSYLNIATYYNTGALKIDLLDSFRYNLCNIVYALNSITIITIISSTAVDLYRFTTIIAYGCYTTT